MAVTGVDPVTSAVSAARHALRRRGLSFNLHSLALGFG